MRIKTLLYGAALSWVISGLGFAAEPPPITFNKNFEGASLGTVEKLGDAEFRCHVEGQYDERGRNRQATWYFFRMDRVRGRNVTLTLADLVGEYNDKPGACAMNADTIPVFSFDGEHWQHFPAMDWDDRRKEATLKFEGRQDSIWIAHVPPYTTRHLHDLLQRIGERAGARIEVIGKTVQGRDLKMITVTNFERPDAPKKTVWLQARQHAWESGTSYVMEGAIQFITSDTPKARELRDRIVFKFTPMMDPDGCANGKVRFNANGYDVNRHWDEVDLRRKEFLERMPEIWYVKKAILACVDSGRPIDLLVNLHNTETGEYMDTQADDANSQRLIGRFYEKLAGESTFDPSQKLQVRNNPSNTTNSLYRERQIPVVLIEQRIAFSRKLGHRPTVEDRRAFGEQLIRVMAETVLAAR